MVPTLILYRNGEIIEQLVAWGTKQEGTLEGAYPGASLVLVIVLPIFLSEIEAVLIQDKILIAPKYPIQREAPPADSDSDGEEEGDVRLGGAGKRKRNIRNSAKKVDSDSDFDL